MRTLFFLLFAATVSGGMISCNENNSEKTAAASLDKEWARSFIDSINAQFSKELAAGDSAGLASHYWPDAELLLDNMEPVKGKDMVASWGEAIRMGMKQLNLTTTDITGTPTFIVETGRYETKDSANNMLDRGKYVVVWENRGGEWKLYRDIGSTSMPPAR